jgi:hypothetical protein
MYYLELRPTCIEGGADRMTFHFDVDCTPEEARRLLGLPDVAAMQERILKEIEDKMQENIRRLDPESLFKTWLPATIQGWGEIQKMFWRQLGVGVPPEQK